MASEALSFIEVVIWLGLGIKWAMEDPGRWSYVHEEGTKEDRGLVGVRPIAAVDFSLPAIYTVRRIVCKPLLRGGTRTGAHKHADGNQRTISLPNGRA